MSRDMTYLYIYGPPERLRVPVLVQPLEINDDIPEESEIEMSVQGLKGGRSEDPSGMRMEDLKGWCQEAKR